MKFTRAACLFVLAALAAGQAVAGGTYSGLASQVAASPSRATAAELKSAQADVDAALKTRKARLDAWQKAQKIRDTAAGDVAKKKKAGVGAADLQDALKNALSLDEAATRARSQLLAAESDLTTKGANLLRLYDALLVDRRRAVEALPAQSQPRAQAVASYRDLAAQRDAVRQALLPVLGASVDVGAAGDLPKGVDLEGKPDDDVETLLEKADLARDLEERFVRQADAVHKRIAELEDEQAVSKGVSGMIGRSALFDEEDRRLLIVGESTRTTTKEAPTTQLAGGSHSPAPPSGSNGAVDFGGTGDVDPRGVEGPELGGTPAAPPPNAFTNVSSTTVPVRTEQVSAPQTDPAIAGLLSSSNVSVESLKSLEAKLKAQADALKNKRAKLKQQASSSK